MEQGKNYKVVVALLVVIIVILLTLVILLATGTISFKSNKITNVDNWNSVVTVKNFEIDSAKVVNAPNYHMAVDGKFVLEGNYDDYLNISFYGHCFDVDNNKYNIMAPSIGHKYDIGENRLDASEMLEYDYGKQYDIYTDNSDKKEWKEIRFKSCYFTMMETTVSKNDKVYQISEDINFEKTFN